MAIGAWVLDGTEESVGKPGLEALCTASTGRRYKLERNIVVHVVEITGRRLGCSSRALRCRWCRPHRSLPRRVATTIATIFGRAAHALAAAQHLHAVGTDVGGEFFDTVFIGVFTGAQAAFDIDLRAFAQVLADDLGQAAVKNHAVPFGGFFHFAG